MSEAPAGRRAGAADAALVVALAIALSPGVFDLLEHWVREPWARYSAVFAPLCVWVAMRGPAPPVRARLGAAVVVVALAVQLLAMLAAMPALALFVVPVPYQLTDWTGGDRLAAELFQLAARGVRVLGVSVAAGSRHVIAGDADLVLDSVHAGLPTVVAMVGLAAFGVLRLGGGVARSAAWAGLLLAVGAVSQGVAAVLACLAVAAGNARLGAVAIETLPWLVPSLGWIAWVERRAATSDRTRRTTS